MHLHFVPKVSLQKLFSLALCLLFFGSWAQAHPQAAVSELASILQDPGSAQAADSQQSGPQTSGNIRGKVVDQSGANITGALVRLARQGQQPSTQPHEAESDEEGQFIFVDIPPGPFQLTVTFQGLATQTVSGNLLPAETRMVPPITLAIATQVTEVHVGLDPIELATEQIHQQEKQRVFGVIPNFYVSYIPDAAPLSPKLKFHLAWKSSLDPVTFVAVGAVAGFEQAGNQWSGYGQGAQGYAKRFAASYADVFTGTYIGGAILPSLLKQDPRYFYKGKGAKRSRILYALSSAVICKSDNGHWQPNYSNIGGNLAAGAIANVYYPSSDRHGASLVFSTALIRIGETALANVFQEFIIPKLTPNVHTRARGQP